MALPIYTSDEDVQKVVDFFKTKPTGATEEEAKPILKKYLDKRKISAYLKWKILRKEGQRLKLDDLGKQLSRTSEDGKKEIYSTVVRNVKAYQACVEWVFHQGYDSISNVEVATFWHENYSSEIGEVNETTMKDTAVCFFYVCQAAGLGKLVMGRKGASTRLEFSKTPLGQFIGETGLSSFEEEETETSENETEQKTEGNNHLSAKEKIEETPKYSEFKKQEEVNHKVFISHSANKEIVDQIKTMLDLASLEYEVAVDKEATAIPVPEKVFSAMRSSTSAIICVTADEKLKTENGEYSINQNVLIEIGAAFVLYDRKVVLVWDKRLIVPSNLQGLYRCEYQGEELSWSAGMKLMKAVTEFKK